MKRATFKYIERELYDYHDSLKQIELLRKDIILQSEHKEKRDENIGTSRSNTVTSEVEKSTTRLLLDTRLNHLQNITNAITSVYNEADSITKKIIELKYFNKNQKLNWEGIALEVYVSVKTARRYRDKFVSDIALKISIPVKGLLNY